MRSGKAGTVSATSRPGRKGVQHLAFLSLRALFAVTLFCATPKEGKVDSQQYHGLYLWFTPEHKEFNSESSLPILLFL